MHDNEESLLYLFECPAISLEDMPVMEIWGLECQEEALRAYREMMTEPNPEVRLGWVRVINDIRRHLRLADEETVKFIMEENEKIYWEAEQERWAQGDLERELEEICMKVTDATSFKEAYDAEVKDYMLQGGNYRRPQYDGAEARRMLQNYLDVGKENIAEQAGLQ